MMGRRNGTMTLSDRSPVDLLAADRHEGNMISQMAARFNGHTFDFDAEPRELFTKNNQNKKA